MPTDGSFESDPAAYSPGHPGQFNCPSERFQDGRAVVFKDSEASQEAFGQIKRHPQDDLFLREPLAR
jgi:hypothetical protein